MSESKKPQIEFPCQYPIKVMGNAGPELYQHIIRVMDMHAPGYKESDISTKISNKATWQSITVVITATGKPQLDALFADLKTSTAVKMVL